MKSLGECDTMREPPSPSQSGHSQQQRQPSTSAPTTSQISTIKRRKEQESDLYDLEEEEPSTHTGQKPTTGYTSLDIVDSTRYQGKRYKRVYGARESREYGKIWLHRLEEGGWVEHTMGDTYIGDERTFVMNVYNCDMIEPSEYRCIDYPTFASYFAREWAEKDVEGLGVGNVTLKKKHETYEKFRGNN